jgi:hypothetical protein
MGLFSASLVVERVRQNRCLKGNEVLASEEVVFCRRCFPSLYQDGLASVEKKQIQAFVTSLLEEHDYVHEAMKGDEFLVSQLRSFFSLLLAKGGELLEAFVHAYMFLFWDFLSFPESIGAVPKGRLFWLAKGAPPGKSHRSGSDVIGLLVARLSQEGVEVDLAAVDIESQTLWLIEIKRAELDDRAVGQMIRYFDRAVYCLPSREFRAGNINFVKPIIILQSVDPKHWITIPLHFRELLDIYTFISPTSRSGELTLTRVRKNLLSAGHRG